MAYLVIRTSGRRVPSGKEVSRLKAMGLVGYEEYPGNSFFCFETEKIEDTLMTLGKVLPDLEIIETSLARAFHGKVSSDPGYELVIRDGQGREGKIYIDSNFSFGSGLHPTTALSMELLASVFRLNRIKDVFDLGTGSGILALCAAQLGAGRVLATDIDMNACKEALYNVAKNGFSDRILIVNDSHEVAAEGRFDLIMANLLYDTIKRLFGIFPLLLKESGYLVLSGLTINQMERLINKQRDLQVISVLKKSGWAAALFSKS